MSDRATQDHDEAPAIARRGGPSGSFADFDLIPLLLIRAKDTGDRDATIKDWTSHLAEVGFESTHIEQDDANTPLAPRVAADAWRFSERIGLLDVDGLTRTGREIASLAFEDMPRCLQALVPILAQGVEGELRGRGGFDTLGRLREAAGKLAQTTNLWVRVIPGLLPIEIGAIVQWARVEPSRAIDLVDNIESWRDVPMHKAGGPRPIQRFRWRCTWSGTSRVSMSSIWSSPGLPSNHPHRSRRNMRLRSSLPGAGFSTSAASGPG